MIKFRYRKQISGALFSFFFLLYAISPLTCSLQKTEAKQHCCSAQEAAPDLTSFRVFLVEILLEAASPPKKKPHEAESDTVPIRKKRALVPENAGEKIFSEAPAALSGNAFFSLPQTRYEWPRTSSGTTGTSRGFRLLYAGHSPPES